MRNFRGYKRDKSWRRHQKRDNVNKEDKSRFEVRDFDRTDDVRYRRRQLEERGVKATSIAISEALCFLHRRPSVDPNMSETTGNTTMGTLISELEVLEREYEVPRASRRDSKHWKQTKRKDKARKAARRHKEQATGCAYLDAHTSQEHT